MFHQTKREINKIQQHCIRTGVESCGSCGAAVGACAMLEQCVGAVVMQVQVCATL